MKTEITTTSIRRRPLIKVCGLTYNGSVDCAAAYGADYVGFDFRRGSSRFVSPLQAAGMPTVQVMRVGVFGPQGAGEIRHIMQQAGLHLAQLPAELGTDCADAVGAGRVICHLRLLPGMRKSAVQQLLDHWAGHCCAFLVDCLDAALLAAVQFPHTWLLSGRMEAAELQRMLRHCRPDGVDIDSHVECARTMEAMRAIA